MESVALFNWSVRQSEASAVGMYEVCDKANQSEGVGSVISDNLCSFASLVWLK